MDLLMIVETATVVVSFIVLASGLPSCIKMYKTQSTKNVPYPLFLVYSFVNILSLMYGVYNNNSALILISLLGLTVFGSYIFIFIMVSKEKNGPITTLTGMVGIYLAHLYYLTLVPSEDFTHTIGFYLLVWSTILAMLPLLDIVTMIREQSSASCDVPILFASTISASTWFVYGRLSNDLNIWAPNVPALILNGIKFLLLIYLALSAKSVVHPIKSDFTKNGFNTHEFHKEVYNVRSRKNIKH